jgi:adenine deaminase
MITESFSIRGRIVDVQQRKIFPGEVFVERGIIVDLQEKEVEESFFILPGFVDAHVHIESSMLVPAEFARVALRHGTVAVVSDPHEIANVCGIEGVEFMVENGKTVPFLFHFGAPSCVPATSFETSGGRIDNKDVETLLVRKDIFFLAEMMNFPGAVNGDADVLAKLELARKYGKKIDGHAPGLRGENLRRYIDRGISTDHECMSLAEAMEKVQAGMKILIREGSAARNMDELLPLLKDYPGEVMFCTDDSHPDTLLLRHINFIVREALKKGYELFDVLRAASFNPVKHYGLEVGLLQKGNKADMIVVKDLDSMEVIQTYINGQIVFKDQSVLIPRSEIKNPINNFLARYIVKGSLLVVATGKRIQVIDMIDGELYTRSLVVDAKTENGFVVSDTERDILKLVVVNRYSDQKPQCAFVKGFKLREGALASSIAHDSHNIVAVGVDDESIHQAVNMVMETKGGLAVCKQGEVSHLSLPVAGLMAVDPAEVVAEKYHRLETIAGEMGSTLRAPFMALSFLSLLVIPELKLSDRGLFDVNKFEFTELFV